MKMSLINKVLSDLETRQAYKNEDRDRVLDGLHSAYDFGLDEQETSRLSPVILVLFLLTVTCSLAYSYQWHKPLMTLVGMNDMSELPANEVNNESRQAQQFAHADYKILKLDDEFGSARILQTQDSITMNRLNSVSLEQAVAGTSILLDFAQDFEYRVYTQDSSTNVVIELEGLELAFPLDSLTPVAPFTKVRAEQYGNGRLELVLESEASITIGNINTLNDGQSYQLLVNVLHESGATNSARAVAESSVDSGVSDSPVTYNRYTSGSNEAETSYKGELVKTPVSRNQSSYKEGLFTRAYSYFNNGELEKSTTLLTDLLTNDPLHVNGRSTLALIYYEQGNADKGLALLDEGLVLEPGQTEWLQVSAKILIKQGKLVEAARQLDRHDPEKTSNSDYYAMKAAVQQQLGNHDEAARIYRDLLKNSDANGAWWMGLGISLESLQRHSDALFAYQQAMDNRTLPSRSRKYVEQRFNSLMTMMNDKSS